MDCYVDGFVIPLPKNKIEEYRRMAELGGKIWKEHGALDYWECLGDDLEVKDMAGFPQLANLGADETVVFSWIVYASREKRDQVTAKVMADPRMQEMCDPDNAPFDCKRVAFGGFKVLVHA